MKKEKQLKLVLWDLDGTLINTIEDLGAAVNHALQKRSLPLHGLDEYTRMVGHGVRNLVAQALPAALQADETLIDSVLADAGTAYPAAGTRHQDGRGLQQIPGRDRAAGR